MRYVGNCTNLFDPETGDCLVDIFRDVSEFAAIENDFHERVEAGEDGFLTHEEFKALVGEQTITHNDWMFYFYPTDTKNIYIAYDPINDVHWFWQ